MTSLLAQMAVGSTTEVVLFVLFAGIGIGAGIAMVMMRNVVHGALMLVINLLSLAGLYLVLQSAFLSIVQVIVYAGAIMVLFLFVIMLLGVDRDDLLIETRPLARGVVVVAAVALVGFVGWGTIGPYTGEAALCEPGATVVRTAGTQTCVGMDAAIEAAEHGSVGVVAEAMFTRWTFPFEAAALLLVVATIGAMLLGRRHETDPDDDLAWVASMALPDGDAAHRERSRGGVAIDHGDPHVQDDSDAEVPAGTGAIAGEVPQAGSRVDHPTVGDDAAATDTRNA